MKGVRSFGAGDNFILSGRNLCPKSNVGSVARIDDHIVEDSNDLPSRSAAWKLLVDTNSTKSGDTLRVDNKYIPDEYDKLLSSNGKYKNFGDKVVCSKNWFYCGVLFNAISQICETNVLMFHFG